MQAKNIVVYCSSREDIPQHHKDCASALGEWIGRNGHTMVYGGVHAGLMSLTAEATHDNGGKVVGVVPEIFLHRRSELNDELITTTDLNHRKAVMIEMGDLYVVLPGGIGTLDEWIATLSHNIVAGEKKKLIIVNLDDVFTAQWQQIANTASSPFAQQSIMDYMVEVKSVEELMKQLEILTSENI